MRHLAYGMVIEGFARARHAFTPSVDSGAVAIKSASAHCNKIGIMEAKPDKHAAESIAR
jgi:hypothetical protein